MSESQLKEIFDGMAEMDGDTKSISKKDIRDFLAKLNYPAEEIDKFAKVCSLSYLSSWCTQDLHICWTSLL